MLYLSAESSGQRIRVELQLHTVTIDKRLLRIVAFHSVRLVVDNMDLALVFKPGVDRSLHKHRLLRASRIVRRKHQSCRQFHDK